MAYRSRKITWLCLLVAPLCAEKYGVFNYQEGMSKLEEIKKIEEDFNKKVEATQKKMEPKVKALRAKEEAAIKKKKAANPDATEQEIISSFTEAEVKELSEMRHKIQAEETAARENLQKEMMEAQLQLKDKLKKGAEKVKEEKNLALILPDEVVLAGGTDITKEVVKEVNDEYRQRLRAHKNKKQTSEQEEE